MKITLPYTPTKNLERGIRVETGENSEMYLTIVEGQTKYEMPDRNIQAIYAYIPFVKIGDLEAEDEVSLPEPVPSPEEDEVSTAIKLKDKKENKKNEIA